MTGASHLGPRTGLEPLEPLEPPEPLEPRGLEPRGLEPRGLEPRGPGAPDTYGLKDIERRIAEDDEAAELAVQVCPVGDRLFVRGLVSGARRRDRVLAIVRDACPGTVVVDELTCVGTELGTEPDGAEEIA